MNLELPKINLISVQNVIPVLLNKTSTSTTSKTTTSTSTSKNEEIKTLFIPDINLKAYENNVKSECNIYYLDIFDQI